MVFDVTRKVTYKNLEKWWQELQEFQMGIPTIVVANKIDADPSVTKKAFAFATKHDVPFFFVSASDGTNVVRVLIPSLYRLHDASIVFIEYIPYKARTCFPFHPATNAYLLCCHCFACH